jgi:hypothetical protein
MRREEKRKLSINRRIIVNHLIDLESVLDYLITKQIFTSSLRQKINKESQGKQDRIRHMLDILESKNIVLAYQYFLEALVVTGNFHVANILEPDYCASEQCRMVIERERMRGFHSGSNGSNGSGGGDRIINEYGNDVVNLPFPVTCTQNHLVESSPGSSSPSSSSSLSNHVSSNVLAPMSIQRIMRQNPNYLLNTNNSNYFLSNVNSSSSQSTSRSTSSSGGYQSNSMSPTINRSRSSSVTAFLNSGRNNNICTSASVNGLLNLAASKSIKNECSTINNQISPNNNNNSVRATVSGMSTVIPYDDSDQVSPSSNNSGPPNLFTSHTPTYNIDWSDVNKLELDFSVTKSFPNIRKQLSPNEVSFFCFCFLYS